MNESITILDIGKVFRVMRSKTALTILRILKDWDRARRTNLQINLGKSSGNMHYHLNQLRENHLIINTVQGWQLTEMGNLIMDCLDKFGQNKRSRIKLSKEIINEQQVINWLFDHPDRVDTILYEVEVVLAFEKIQVGEQNATLLGTVIEKIDENIIKIMPSCLLDPKIYVEYIKKIKPIFEKYGIHLIHSQIDDSR